MFGLWLLAQVVWAQEPNGTAIPSPIDLPNWGFPCFPEGWASPRPSRAETIQSYYGGTFTPRREMRMLVIYASLVGDNDLTVGGIPQNNNSNGIWPQEDPANGNPNWGDALPVDAYTNQVYYTDPALFNASATDPSLSNYYYQMSRFAPHGQPLKLVVKHLPHRVNVPYVPSRNYYVANGDYYAVDMRRYDQDIINKVAQDYDGSPYTMNWPDLDQRTNDPNFGSDNSTSAPDNKIDFTVIVWRIPGYTRSYNGRLAYEIGAGGQNTSYNSPTPLTLGPGTTGQWNFGSGFVQIFGFQGLNRNLFLHEIAHGLYNAPHYYGANGTVGKHFTSTAGWGMMGPSIALVANGWERWYNGWIDIKANGINTNIADASGLTNGGIYTLHDYATTGDVMRIKIPFSDQATDPNSGQLMPPQYLWLENHQGISNFDQRPWGNDGNGQPFPPSAKGLFAFVDDMRTDDQSTIVHYFDRNYVNAFKTLANHVVQRDNTAGATYNNIVGSWGGNNDFTVVRPPSRFNSAASGNPNSGYLWPNYTYNLTSPLTNPLTGQSEVSGIRMDKHDFIDWNNGNPVSAPDTPGTIRYDACNGNGDCGTGNEGAMFGVMNGSRMGGLQGPDIGFNEVGDKLGMMTNPAITPHQRYSEISKEQSAIWFHGLSVEVIAKNPTTGDLTVRVRFDDTDVQGTTGSETRWCGRLVVDDIPGVANDIRVLPNTHVRVDKSGTPNRHTPNPLTGDFVDLTTMACRPNTLFQVDGGARLSVQNHSTFTLEGGARLNVGAGGVVRIESGSTLYIENDAELIAASGARVEVAQGAKLFIRNTVAGKGLRVLQGAQLVVTGNGQVIVTNGARLDLLSAPATGQTPRLTLQDNASEIITHGLLTTAANVPFTFGGTGQITFDGAGAGLTLGTGSAWVQSGPGRPNTLYRFLNGAQISVQTPSLQLSQGKLVYETGSSLEVEMNGGDAALTFLDFAGDAANRGDRALTCQGPSNLTATNCLFHGFTTAGLTVNKSGFVTVNSSYVSDIKGPGLTFTDCVRVVLDRGYTRDCDIGVALTDVTLLYLRNRYIIENSRQMGIKTLAPGGVPNRIIAGDQGCAWIINNNAGGIVGSDTYLHLDALLHQAQSGSPAPQINRFDGNTPTAGHYIFDICYTNPGLVPPAGPFHSALGNYWGPCVAGNYSPVSGTDYRLEDCPSGSGQLAYDLKTPDFLTCPPLGCAGCEDDGDGGGGFGERAGADYDPAPAAALALSLAPNPTHDQTTLTVAEAGPYQYRVVSSRGETVATGAFTGRTLTLRTAAWAGGAYRVVLWRTSGAPARANQTLLVE